MASLNRTIMGVFLRNDNWYISYFYKGRRMKEKGGPSKDLAKKALKKREVEVAEERFLDVRKIKRVRFNELSADYLRLHAQGKKSLHSHYEVCIKHLGNYFAHSYLHEITPKRIEDYKAEALKSGASFASVNRRLACLKSMFNRAIDWHMAEENPVRKVKLFKENNQRVRYLEQGELAKLLEHSSLRLRAVILFAVNTGMRKGEIQRLRWSEINFNQGYLTAIETKNGETRYVPINDTVKEVLLSIRKNPDSPYVFCAKDGESYDFRKSFETALGKSGIIDFRFHDLRHTFASHLAMKGVDLNTIRELLGHKSLDMTLRYSHLSKDHKMRAVSILDKHVPKVSPALLLTDEAKSVESVSSLEFVS